MTCQQACGLMINYSLKRMHMHAIVSATDVSYTATSLQILKKPSACKTQKAIWYSDFPSTNSKATPRKNNHGASTPSSPVWLTGSPCCQSYLTTTFATAVDYGALLYMYVHLKPKPAALQCCRHLATTGALETPKTL